MIYWISALKPNQDTEAKQELDDILNRKSCAFVSAYLESLMDWDEIREEMGYQGHSAGGSGRGSGHGSGRGSGRGSGLGPGRGGGAQRPVSADPRQRSNRDTPPSKSLCSSRTSSSSDGASPRVHLSDGGEDTCREGESGRAGTGVGVGEGEREREGEEGEENHDLLLTLSCTNLRETEMFSRRPNGHVVVKTKLLVDSHSSSAWKVLGETEVIKKSSNPAFVNSFEIR
jgi:hypothetical protein